MLGDKLAQLIGAKCRNFRLIEGGDLVLYLQSHCHDPKAIVESTLWLELAWRLRIGNEIVAGSRNDAPVAVEKLRRLLGQCIVDLTCDGISKDLRIEFTMGDTIESFSHSTQDDVWEFRREDGYRLGVNAGLQTYERYEAS